MGIGSISKSILKRAPHGPTSADGAERRAEDRKSNAPQPGSGLPRTADAAERWQENRSDNRVKNLKDGFLAANERRNQSEAAASYSGIYN